MKLKKDNDKIINNYIYIYIYMKTMMKYDENLFETFTK